MKKQVYKVKLKNFNSEILLTVPTQTLKTVDVFSRFKLQIFSVRCFDLSTFFFVDSLKFCQALLTVCFGRVQISAGSFKDTQRLEAAPDFPWLSALASRAFFLSVAVRASAAVFLLGSLCIWLNSLCS